MIFAVIKGIDIIAWILYNISYGKIGFVCILLDFKCLNMKGMVKNGKNGIK